MEFFLLGYIRITQVYYCTVYPVLLAIKEIWISCFDDIWSGTPSRTRRMDCREIKVSLALKKYIYYIFLM